MAVSDTVVQILGEPCLLSLLRSSTCNKYNLLRSTARQVHEIFTRLYLTSPGGFVVGLQVLVVVVKLGLLLLLLLLLQGNQVSMFLLQLPLQALGLTLLLQLLSLIFLSKERKSQRVAGL